MDDRTMYVLGFLFNKDMSQVVLINKKRPEWQNGLWNALGGHVEYRESSYQAMQREFIEEAGYDCRWDSIGFMYNDRFWCNIFISIDEADDLYDLHLESGTDEVIGIFSMDEVFSIHKQGKLIDNVLAMILLCKSKHGGNPYLITIQINKEDIDGA